MDSALPQRSSVRLVCVALAWVAGRRDVDFADHIAGASSRQLEASGGRPLTFRRSALQGAENSGGGALDSDCRKETRSWMASGASVLPSCARAITETASPRLATEPS